MLSQSTRSALQLPRVEFGLEGSRHFLTTLGKGIESVQSTMVFAPHIGHFFASAVLERSDGPHPRVATSIVVPTPPGDGSGQHAHSADRYHVYARPSEMALTLPNPFGLFT